MSEAEKPEAKPGKRMVSKGEYVAHISRKGATSSFGAMLIVLSLGVLLLSVMWIYLVIDVLMASRMSGSGKLVIGLFMVSIHTFIAFLLYHFGRNNIEKAKQMEIGVPITRANMGDLPAPESLVRASEQPLQVQENVLLRAATSGKETPVEQLVRPAGGQD